MKHQIFLFVSLLALLMTGESIFHSVAAAEKIVFKLGPIKRAISVKSVENFVVNNQEDPEILFITRNLTPEQKAKARGLLGLQFTEKQWHKVFADYELPPVNNNSYITRALNSPSGQELLSEIGKIVRLPDNADGQQAIKATIFTTSINPAEFSILNFLRKFPGDIYVNIEELSRILDQWERGSESENTLIQRLELLNANYKQDHASGAVLTEKLVKPGNFQVSSQTLNLLDPQRQRQFTAKLYLPSVQLPNTRKVPVIILSNGMGLSLNSLDFLALHLASHGFAVGIPDAIGSNNTRQRNFFLGNVPTIAGNFDSNEYIHRPLDITYLLNELERLNNIKFQNRLDLQQVGVFGYSFGAVTALSLGGANFDFKYLQKDCDSRSKLLNLSLLYQCRALELSTPERQIPLQDSRIKSLFLFVPMGYSLFGYQKLQAVNLPTAWQATVQDPFTPMVQEQLPGFMAMQNPHKYFSIALNVGHLENSTTQATNNNHDFETNLKTMTTAFFKVHLTGERSYQQYLTISDQHKLSIPSEDNLWSKTPY
jgi:predicted dienelactone hydrolase